MLVGWHLDSPEPGPATIHHDLTRNRGAARLKKENLCVSESQMIAIPLAFGNQLLLI
jgi:hypothetical protein